MQSSCTYILCIYIYTYVYVCVYIYRFIYLYCYLFFVYVFLSDLWFGAFRVFRVKGLWDFCVRVHGWLRCSVAFRKLELRVQGSGA